MEEQLRSINVMRAAGDHDKAQFNPAMMRMLRGLQISPITANFQDVLSTNGGFRLHWFHYSEMRLLRKTESE